MAVPQYQEIHFVKNGRKSTPKDPVVRKGETETDKILFSRLAADDEFRLKKDGKVLVKTDFTQAALVSRPEVKFRILPHQFVFAQ